MGEKYSISYADALNESQLDAVTFHQGPLLVIAGAGSGKTRTLTYRVARLVEDGISPSSILLLTFTRKAAGEMLQRATTLLDKRCAQVAGGTFHSFAHRILRKYASHINFGNNFSILDRQDSENLIGLIRKELNPKESLAAFPRKQTLNSLYSRAVNKVRPIEDIVEEDYPHFYPFMESIQSIWRVYGQRKIEHNFFDYDDLLVLLQRLLQEDADVRNYLASIYRYIMVDEYQDTNPIQADIVQLLAGEHRNIMVVGDDSQSIYSFRGADFQNILRFPEIFPEARIIRLEENYRSVQPILDLTNSLIDRAQHRFTKTLFTRNEGGSPPQLVAAANENSQSRFIVDTLFNIERSGVPLNEIAVLFRAGFHSFDLEIELGREGIPFVKVGGFKFMESAHIKDVLSHLRVWVNPADRLSWLRLFSLLDKIGPKTAESFYEAIRQSNAGAEGLPGISIKTRNTKGVDRLKELFAHLGAHPMRPADMGQAIVEYYEPFLVNAYDDYPKRARDLEQLLSIMERYSELELFLTDMALEPPTASADNSLFNGENATDRLVLSTVHSAKGLEWHTVFVIWALDGRFPSVHALQREDDLEEELRLMYVAATRARKNLFFIYPIQGYDRSTGLFLTRPSRFIDGLPDDILEKKQIDFY